jgi:thiamine-phosphate pyrophosphorylase
MSSEHDDSKSAQHPATGAQRLIRGLYAITPDEIDTASLAARVVQALAGGIALLQYRNKAAGLRLRREQASALLPLCRAAGVPLIINDDLALALEIGADGVHLGSDDGDLTAARSELGPRRLLGASCYNRAGLARIAKKAGADYVAFGSVFPSSSKPGTVRAPLELFTAMRAELGLPLVAIGGITHENAAQVFAAGADAVAVIRDLFDAPDVAARARQFAAVIKPKKASAAAERASDKPARRKKT